MKRSAAAQLQAFLADRRMRRLSPSLDQRARTTLPRFMLHLKEEGITDLRQTREAHVVSFARRLQEMKTRDGKPLSPWTQAAYLGAVKAFLSFLTQRGVLLLNPAEHVPLPKGQRLPRPIPSPRQAERLIGTPDMQDPPGLRDRAILETLYGTGIRLSECVRLDLTDLDLQAGVLFVRNGKGRKDRLVPLVGRAALALSSYLQRGRPHYVEDPKETALFLSRFGKRLGPASVEILIRKHARARGLSATPHALRHACATHLLQGGADVRHIQELLGHKKLETTALYTRVAMGDLREALRRAHPRARR